MVLEDDGNSEKSLSRTLPPDHWFGRANLTAVIQEALSCVHAAVTDRCDPTTGNLLYTVSLLNTLQMLLCIALHCSCTLLTLRLVYGSLIISTWVR
ncbi:unnamed protein product [Arabidopsis halleri]